MEVCRCSIVSVKLTRLSGKVAPALKGTEQVGVTSVGLVKAQTWFPPPFWKPGVVQAERCKKRPVFLGWGKAKAHPRRKAEKCQ